MHKTNFLVWMKATAQCAGRRLCRNILDTKNMINTKHIIHVFLFVIIATIIVLVSIYSTKRGKSYLLETYNRVLANYSKLDYTVARLHAHEASLIGEQPVSNVFAMFDAVGPYRKNGLFEIYGANLRERRKGPIQVSQSEIEVTHDEAWAIWAPDHTLVRDATHLVIDFIDMPQLGNLAVGFLFQDGDSGVFTYNTGEVPQAQKNMRELFLPATVVDKARIAKSVGEFSLTGNRLIVALSPEYVNKFKSEKSGRISHWFLKLNGFSGTTIKIKQLALVRTNLSQDDFKSVTLSGRLKGLKISPGDEIELLDESGRLIIQKLSLDGGFTFGGVDPSRPVSIRLREPVSIHYTTLGRWFLPSYSRSDLVVSAPVRYLNNDGHAPNQKAAKFIGAQTPSKVAAFYEPHSRQYWPGAGMIKEYDSTTFANNHGYIDRDRFFDNPDGCIRIASTGGSDMVALQVRPFEKSNIIMEETLGIALGKCVEVISAATDNGDISVNFPRIRDYTSKFKPDITLVSTLSGLLFQVSPKMLRDGTGLDPENSSLPNFYYNKNGALTFRTASPVSAIYMIKPSNPEYLKGVPFSQTLTVPFEVMPKEGIEAFNYWNAILTYINNAVPGQNFVMHSGLDQAQCRLNCEPSISINRGGLIQAGANGFVRNLNTFCREKNYKCIHPKFDKANGENENLLTFEYDGHYSVRGHQWLAQELTKSLTVMLKKSK